MMKSLPISEKLMIEEVSQVAKRAKALVGGLTIGGLIKSIRLQLGMSQAVLAKRAGVPQSTVSRVEQGERETSLSTLNKIMEALSCQLVVIPLLCESVDVIREKQARKLAQKHIDYLKGTMHLEEQEPDFMFMEELVKQEKERILYSPNSKLWENDV